MVKPYKIFLLLLLLLSLALLPSLFFPYEGLKIFDFTFQYPSIHQLLEIDTSQNQPTIKPEIARLDKMVDSTLNIHRSDVSLSTFTNISDSLSYQDSTKKIGEIPIKEINADYLRSKISRLEFPDSNHLSLIPFFEALGTKAYNRRLVRILHYGDSQIEGDRITSYLRSRLQAKYGGGGIGLVHAVPQSCQPAAIVQSISSNWVKTTLADYDKKSSGINRFGALGGYSVFKPSQSIFSSSTNEAWIQFKLTGEASNHQRNFDRVRIFYGFNSKPFMVEMKCEGKVSDAELIPITNNLCSFFWEATKGANTFEVKFSGDSSPMVFGLSLETSKGIIVDNIPIRGSSGVDFTKTDMSFMKEMLRMLDVKLIILQFGVNVVPNVVESYKYYQNQLYSQIRSIQSAVPDASIIMVGVSDVSRKEGLRYTSYPNIEKIRDAQREAAFKAGIPFWDCYKAMGGKSSMAAWESTNPPLASKDFIHFTFRGANLIAEMFYSALMSEYEDFTMKNNKLYKNKIVQKNDSTNILTSVRCKK